MRIPGWKDLGCSPPAWWKKSPLGRSVAHVECPRPLWGRLDGSKVFPQCELKSAFLFSSTHWPCPPDQHVKKASSKESFKWMACSARSESSYRKATLLLWQKAKAGGEREREGMGQKPSVWLLWSFFAWWAWESGSLLAAILHKLRCVQRRGDGCAFAKWRLGSPRREEWVRPRQS